MSHYNVYATEPKKRASPWQRVMCRLLGHRHPYQMTTFIAPVQERATITFCGRCHRELACVFPDVTPLAEHEYWPKADVEAALQAIVESVRITGPFDVVPPSVHPQRLVTDEEMEDMARFAREYDWEVARHALPDEGQP